MTLEQRFESIAELTRLYMRVDNEERWGKFDQTDSATIDGFMSALHILLTDDDVQAIVRVAEERAGRLTG